MQILSKSFYYEVMPRACETLDTPVRFVEEDLAEKPMFVQYYEGCLLVVDIASAMDLQRRLNKKKVPKLEWQAIIPNPFGSDQIQKELFFGRAILVPGNRVFVISGSLQQKVTDTLSDEVQEWDLDTMIVKKVQKIPDARTSAAAYFHGRFIYIIGGNLKKSRSTDMCCKLDIYKRKWYNMPNMNEHRANSGSMVINNFLYAFGGFQT